MLGKAASSTIFCVFGMTRPGIEPWSPGPLANTLLIQSRKKYQCYFTDSNTLGTLFSVYLPKTNSVRNLKDPCLSWVDVLSNAALDLLIFKNHDSEC